MPTRAELEMMRRQIGRESAAVVEQPPADLHAAFAGHDELARARSVQALQRSCGNAAVQRMIRHARAADAGPRIDLPATPSAMETHTEVQSFQLNAAIRIAGQPARSAPRRSSVSLASDSDSMPGDDKHDELSEIESILGASVTATDATPAAPAASDATPSPSGAESGGSAAAPGAEGGAPSAAAPGPETGAVPAAQTGAAQQEETIRLPNIEVHDFENVDLCDAISPWLSYNGTISQGGAPPSGFGVTRPGPMTVADITVRKVPLIGWWYVSATINQQIQWQVRAATGPTGQVNIGSALDPAITTANWPTVVSDLTPDMSDLQGRPPRNAFWAKDITETHEQFHANDRKTQAPAALALASAWLGTQQAATAADVAPLLATVPGRMVATVTAGMTYPGKEERAYSDGAGAYSRRALAISALGTVGYY